MANGEKILAEIEAAAVATVGTPLIYEGKPLLNRDGSPSLARSGGHWRETPIGEVGCGVQPVAGMQIKARHWRTTWNLNGKTVSKAELLKRFAALCVAEGK